MGPNVCSLRSLRVILATVIFLFAFAGNVRAQREARTNRVWSLHISFVFCGATLDSVSIARVGLDGEVGPWQRANKELIIIQWNQDLPNKQGELHRIKYVLQDLLADFGQTRYVLQLIGRGSTEGSRFSSILWVSPAGIAKEPISLAPIRENREEDWTEKERQEFSDWYLSHDWVRSDFFREFGFLLSKSDKKIDFPIRIQSSIVDCEPTKEEEGGSNERHVVVLASNSARRVDRV